MKDFRDLDVWRKPHQLTLNIYRAMAAFPKTEKFGLISQMRRAASSIGANIAEGCGRKTDADFARFLQNAFGCASELEYFLLLSFDLGFLKKSEHDRLSENTIEIKKMLAALLRKLNADR